MVPVVIVYDDSSEGVFRGSTSRLGVVPGFGPVHGVVDLLPLSHTKAVVKTARSRRIWIRMRVMMRMRRRVMMRRNSPRARYGDDSPVHTWRSYHSVHGPGSSARPPTRLILRKIFYPRSSFLGSNLRGSKLRGSKLVVRSFVVRSGPFHMCAHVLYGVYFARTTNNECPLDFVGHKRHGLNFVLNFSHITSLL